MRNTDGRDSILKPVFQHYSPHRSRFVFLMTFYLYSQCIMKKKNLHPLTMFLLMLGPSSSSSHFFLCDICYRYRIWHLEEFVQRNIGRRVHRCKKKQKVEKNSQINECHKTPVVLPLRKVWSSVWTTQPWRTAAIVNGCLSQSEVMLFAPRKHWNGTSDTLM